MNDSLRNYLSGPDVVKIAQGLIGTELRVCQQDGAFEAFRIVETEAYRHYKDAASHARKGFPTPRTAPMFGPAGHSYVYLCYGIHSLFNIVTNVEGRADAVLVRALERHNNKGEWERIVGPGKVGKALGITTQMSGHNLARPPLQLVGLVDGHRNTNQSGSRVGVEYAGKDALLPWRFWLP